MTTHYETTCIILSLGCLCAIYYFPHTYNMFSLKKGRQQRQAGVHLQCWHPWSRCSGLMGRGSSAFKKTLCKLHDYKDYTGNPSLQCNNCDRVQGTFSFAIVTTLYKYISASFLLDVWGKWTTLSTSGFYTARTPQLKDANVHNNGQIYPLKKLNAGIDVISPLHFILISKHFINFNDPWPSKYTEKLSVTKLTSLS